MKQESKTEEATLDGFIFEELEEEDGSKEQGEEEQAGDARNK